LRRSDAGTGPGADGVVNGFEQGIVPFAPVGRAVLGSNRLAGMEPVKARLQAGFFINHYLNPQWRLTNSVLYGAGREADGLVWQLGLQHLARQISQHHAWSLAAGVTLVNARYNASYFGVTETESVLSGNAQYAPGAGVKDLYLQARWNWTLSPSWILSSGVRATQLQGDARHSPLVVRPTNVAVSTGLAYRF
jgi:outer membrane scaffolding protein for murein synthesis (MipA/OmpV family)